MSYTTSQKTADPFLSLFKYIIHFRDKTGPNTAQSTHYTNDTPREREQYLRGAKLEAREACMAISRALQKFNEMDTFMYYAQPEYLVTDKLLKFHVPERLFETIETFDNRFGLPMLDAVTRKNLAIDQITYEKVSIYDPKHNLFGRKPTTNHIKLSGYSLIVNFLCLKPDFIHGKILKIDLFDNLNYSINNRIKTFVPAIYQVANQAVVHTQQPQSISNLIPKNLQQ